MRRSWILALLMTLSLAAWIGSGQLQLDVTGEGGGKPLLVEQTTASKPKKMQRVTVSTSIASEVDRSVTLHGITAPSRRVTLRAEGGGRIVSIAVERGERVEKGALIAYIDRRERDQLLVEARALLKQRELEYRAAERLRVDGLRAESQLADALTQLESARARVRAIELEIGRLSIRAPFSSTLEERPVEIGSYLADGDPVAQLVELDPLKVVATASELQISSLTPGQPAEVELIDGRRVAGVVRYLSALADQATRTFTVEIEIGNSDQSIRSGMTARSVIKTGSTTAHALSPALLTLNAGGEAGVMVVEQDRVRFMPVTLVRSTPERVWLEGLPDRIRLIVIGHGFVRDGQQVEVVNAE